MQPQLKLGTALVFGGTGTVGSAVVRNLSSRGIPVVFTYCASEEKARALEAETLQRALHLDLRNPDAIEPFLRDLTEDIGIFIHCAATSRAATLEDISNDEWQAVQTVNATSAFVATRGLAPRMVARGGGRIVFVGALAPNQAAAVPVHFAATQGMLSSMTMALAKELGGKNVLVNMLALGLLESGLSREISPQLVADYKTFSALRRLGNAQEAARVIAWLALENSYINGEVVTVNGGV
jgi:3-oxoacyl-[acyl-carrier protein] reductase